MKDNKAESFLAKIRLALEASEAGLTDPTAEGLGLQQAFVGGRGTVEGVRLLISLNDGSEWSLAPTMVHPPRRIRKPREQAALKDSET